MILALSVKRGYQLGSKGSRRIIICPHPLVNKQIFDRPERTEDP
jgi:hypothetical protein